MFINKKKYQKEIEDYQAKIVQWKNLHSTLLGDYKKLVDDYVELSNSKKELAISKSEKTLSQLCDYAILVKGNQVDYFDTNRFRDDYTSIDFCASKTAGPELLVEK